MSVTPRAEVMRRSRRGRSAAAGWMVAVGVAAAVMVWAWWWRAQILAHPVALPRQESWDAVKTDFPLPHTVVELAPVPEAMLQSIVRANPFDVERRRKAPEGGVDAAQSHGVVEPPAPQLIYKGRVNLGSRQRAIVEDTAAHKTYFLEVGQEVAGCKLLDIQETQVILSTLNTKEEVVVSLATAGRPPVSSGPAKHVGSP